MTRFHGALGRWRKPRLGAAVLAGCLMIGHPGLADVATSDWTPVAPVQLAAPLPSSPTLNKERGNIPESTVAHGQSTGSAMSDVLHAALGTALAALWLMSGVWVGIRSARISTPLNQSADQTRDARRIRFM